MAGRPNKKSKLVFGVGVNDTTYVTQKHHKVNGKKVVYWQCPYMIRWSDMLRRVYSKRELEKHVSYRGCSVCDEWLSFMSFRQWMLTQKWEGLELDKDLKVEGNKIYSPNTCMFVPKLVNGFMTEKRKSKGLWPTGVTFHKRDQVFEASCNNPFTHKNEYLGRFNCPEKASLAYRARKYELACQLAAMQSDTRIAEALIRRYQV